MNASCTPAWSGTVQGTLVYESLAPARVAELVDATDSKSVVREDVGVRVPPWVPYHVEYMPFMRCLLSASVARTPAFSLSF